MHILITHIIRLYICQNFKAETSGISCHMCIILKKQTEHFSSTEPFFLQLLSAATVI